MALCRLGSLHPCIMDMATIFTTTKDIMGRAIMGKDTVGKDTVCKYTLGKHMLGKDTTDLALGLTMLMDIVIRHRLATTVGTLDTEQLSARKVLWPARQQRCINSIANQNRILNDTG